MQGRIQDLKLGGAHLKKLRRAEGSANIFGLFRVKNHDFTPTNHIFSSCGGRRENCWGISCEKSRFYAKKIIFFPILGGCRPPHPPGSAPGFVIVLWFLFCSPLFSFLYPVLPVSLDCWLLFAASVFPNVNLKIINLLPDINTRSSYKKHDSEYHAPYT